MRNAPRALAAAGCFPAPGKGEGGRAGAARTFCVKSDTTRPSGDQTQTPPRLPACSNGPHQAAPRRSPSSTQGKQNHPGAVAPLRNAHRPWPQGSMPRRPKSFQCRRWPFEKNRPAHTDGEQARTQGWALSSIRRGWGPRGGETMERRVRLSELPGSPLRAAQGGTTNALKSRPPALPAPRRECFLGDHESRLPSTMAPASRTSRLTRVPLNCLSCPSPKQSLPPGHGSRTPPVHWVSERRPPTVPRQKPLALPFPLRRFGGPGGRNRPPNGVPPLLAESGRGRTISPSFP